MPDRSIEILPTPVGDSNSPEKLPKAQVEKGQEIKLTATDSVKSRLDSVRKVDSPSGYISKRSDVSAEIARHIKEILKVWNAKTGNRFPDPDMSHQGIDSATDSLIRKFQSENIDIARKVDGIIGPRTWRAMEERILKPYVGSIDAIYGFSQLSDAEFLQIIGEGPAPTFDRKEEPAANVNYNPDGASNDLTGQRTISFQQALNIVPTKLMSDYADAVVSEARKINPDLKGSLHECAGPPRRAAGKVGITNGEDTNGSAPGGQSARLYPDWFVRGKHRDNYVEVTDVPQDKKTLEEMLPKLPKGAVVQYLDASRPSWHGHIQVALGDGKFISDFVHDELVYRRVMNVRVFLPAGSYDPRYS